MPPQLGLDLGAGQRATLMVRPEFVRFLTNGETADFVARGRLHGVYALGSRFQYEVELGSGTRATVEKLREDAFAGAPGSEVLLGFDADHVHLIGAA